MSAISDYASQVNTAFNAISSSVDSIVQSQQGITNDIAQLKATIEKLQNSPGQISQEDQALLNAIQEQANQLSAKAKSASEALAQLDSQTENVPEPEPA